MATGTIKKNLSISQVQETGTTSSSGRFGLSINPAKYIILRGYVEGQTYIITPYIFATSSSIFNYNVEVTSSETGAKVANTQMTIKFDVMAI